MGVDTAGKDPIAVKVLFGLAAVGCRLVTGFLGRGFGFDCFSGNILTWRVVEFGLELSRCFFGFKPEVVGLFAGSAVFFTGGRAVGLTGWVVKRV